MVPLPRAAGMSSSAPSSLPGVRPARASSRSVSADEHRVRAPEPSPRPWGSTESIGLASTFAAFFFLSGVALPYWPTWLGDAGMSPREIGVLLGVGMWARLLAPQVGAWADRSGHSRELVWAAAALGLGCYLGFGFVAGFMSLLLLSLALGCAHAPVVPLLDGMALQASAAGRLDYGRVRAWGSIAFIAAAVVGGRWLEQRDAAAVLSVLQIAGLAVLLASFLLRPVAHGRGGTPVPLRVVLRQPGLPTLLLAVACLHGSHAVLYGFGTKHWLAIGIDEGTVGWFWGVGVTAEVLLFAVGQRVVRALGASGMLVVAGLCATLRWLAFAELASVTWLLVVSVLHAASFGAMHLGAMHWLREHVPTDRVHRATASYAAVASGLAMGVAMPVAGFCFDAWAGGAFRVMAALALIGALVSLRLGRVGVAQPTSNE